MSEILRSCIETECNVISLVLSNKYGVVVYLFITCYAICIYIQCIPVLIWQDIYYTSVYVHDCKGCDHYPYVHLTLLVTIISIMFVIDIYSMYTILIILIYLYITIICYIPLLVIEKLAFCCMCEESSITYLWLFLVVPLIHGYYMMVTLLCI